MSEYWVSQGRKMCSYCKCWIADNKASINFHESGKNHKENVKKKLDELRKKGVRDAKNKEKMKSDLAKMEKAALAALKKDIEANPSMASAYGIASDKLEAVQEALIKNDPSTSAEPASQVQRKKKSTGPKDGKFTQPQIPETMFYPSPQQSKGKHYKGDWNIARTPEGHSYYWNTVTNETSWYAPDSQPPPPGIVTPEIESDKKTSDANTDSRFEKKCSIVSAYGSWQAVKEEALPQLDLPTDSTNFTTETEDIPLPTKEPTPAEKPAAQKRFKEKVVSLNASSGSVAFKKRKLGNARQNRRKAEDDDD